jgi:hypothetical protein
MKRTIIAAATAILAIGLIGAATPASAARATPPYDISLPEHVTWQAHDFKPPLKTLLRVFVPVKTNYTPRKFTGLVTLYVFKLVMTKTGPKWEAKRAKGAPAAHLGLSDLAAPGDTVTWKFGGPPIFPDWYCKKGRYFIAWSSHVTTDTGQHVHSLYFTPYLKGHPVPHVKSAFGVRAPDYAEGHRIRKC